MTELHPETIAILAGRGEGRPGEPVNPALVLTSTFHAGGAIGYARDDHPNRAAFEEALGRLEGGTAVTFASGMAAATAVLEELPVGARVVAPRFAYKNVRSLLRDRTATARVEAVEVDIADTDAALAACDGAAMLWIESPTNPMLEVADLAALSEGARRRGAAVVVDSTFATPLLQRPLALGADVVVHSATKFIGGHADLLLGVAICADPERAARLRDVRTDTGAVPGALETWLALRGLRTLAVRLERGQASAMELAVRLSDHPEVDRVRYPGLPADPGHALAARQMDGFGAVLAFEPSGGAERAEAVCERVRVLTHATSLGGVETLIERRSRYPGERDVPPALIRVSVGCEHVEDLWADLAGALEETA
jgi:cystathionine gamma-synthase